MEPGNNNIENMIQKETYKELDVKEVNAIISLTSHCEETSECSLNNFSFDMEIDSGSRRNNRQKENCENQEVAHDEYYKNQKIAEREHYENEERAKERDHENQKIIEEYYKMQMTIKKEDCENQKIIQEDHEKQKIAQEEYYKDEETVQRDQRKNWPVTEVENCGNQEKITRNNYENQNIQLEDHRNWELEQREDCKSQEIAQENYKNHDVLQAENYKNQEIVQMQDYENQKKAPREDCENQEISKGNYYENQQRIYEDYENQHIEQGEDYENHDEANLGAKNDEIEIETLVKITKENPFPPNDQSERYREANLDELFKLPEISLMFKILPNGKNAQAQLTQLNKDVFKARLSKKLAICASCREIIGNADIFNLLPLLHSHRIDLIKGLGFVCEICPLITIDREQFEGHQLEHIFNGQAYCIQCRKQIVSLSIEPMFEAERISDLIQTRLKSGRGRNIRFTNRIYTRWPPRCGKCGLIFDYITALIHKILEFPPTGSLPNKGNYICHVCHLQGSAVNEMELHVIDHIDSGEILCKRCNEEYEL